MSHASVLMPQAVNGVADLVDVIRQSCAGLTLPAHHITRAIIGPQADNVPNFTLLDPNKLPSKLAVNNILWQDINYPAFGEKLTDDQIRDLAIQHLSDLSNIPKPDPDDLIVINLRAFKPLSGEASKIDKSKLSIVISPSAVLTFRNGPVASIDCELIGTCDRKLSKLGVVSPIEVARYFIERVTCSNEEVIISLERYLQSLYTQHETEVGILPEIRKEFPAFSHTASYMSLKMAELHTRLVRVKIALNGNNHQSFGIDNPNARHSVLDNLADIADMVANLGKRADILQTGINTLQNALLERDRQDEKKRAEAEAVHHRDIGLIADKVSIAVGFTAPIAIGLAVSQIAMNIHEPRVLIPMVLGCLGSLALVVLRKYPLDDLNPFKSKSANIG